jgi:energy-coupling factor transporter ATP-binding protein EcfA2
MEFFGRVKPETDMERISVLVLNYDYSVPLLGKLVKINVGSAIEGLKEEDFFIVGRIVNIKTLNKALEDPSGFREAQNIENFYEFDPGTFQVKKDASLPLSYFLVLEVEPLTAFRNGKRDSYGYGIPVGTTVELLNEDNFNLKSYIEKIYQKENKEKPALYPIGYYINTNIQAYIDFSDFKKLGEAYHYTVAGQTGSGKSTLVQMLLAGYGLSNPKMKFIILDTVGEFRDSFKVVNRSRFINLGEIFSKDEYEIYSIPDNVALDRWEVFQELLYESKLIENYFAVKRKENMNYAINKIEEVLRREFNLEDLYKAAEAKNGGLAEKLSRYAEEIALFTYKDQNTRELLIQAILQATGSREFIDELKDKVLKYFYVGENSRKKKVADIVHSIFLRNNERSAKFFVFDMTSLSDDRIKKKVLYEIFKETYRVVVSSRKVEDANTLIVLEEAHNWAPRYSDDDYYDSERLSNIIVKSYKELRKFGIGLMAITTRISGIRREIFEHSRVKIIGGGLVAGADRELLKNEFGDEIENIYATFGDLKDPFSTAKQANFLISGPITLLSRSHPEFITVYNNKDDYLKNFQDVLVKKNGNKELNGSIVGNLKIDENFDISDLM